MIMNKLLWTGSMPLEIHKADSSRANMINEKKNCDEDFCLNHYRYAILDVYSSFSPIQCKYKSKTVCGFEQSVAINPYL
ncbi:Hypothetical predicted protein [Octopus vulgaris]|uniref:Uncharacterized protein n=1 Tax=Octopus vulgaris TaxID=6645 RepID=A0AA36AF55_OCTVU|nr:Hypothetical predicted protein [Octopus vulgaris]